MLAALLASIVIAPPAALPHATGWQIAAGRVSTVGCRRCVQTVSRASTVPDRDAPNDFPQRTMAVLGPDDAIVLVTRSWEPSPPKWTFERHPLRIVRAQIHASFEGNPTKNRVSMWSGTTWRDGSFVSVYAYFGSPIPTAADVARVQCELDGARYAPWTIT